MASVKALIHTIDSIFGGQQAVFSYGDDDQFLSSVGIDIEQKAGSLDVVSGAIVPSRYEKFSGEFLYGYPVWISGAQSTAGVFVYDSAGSVVSYSSLLAGEEDIANLPGGTGNGMAIYNDYVYCASGSTVHRYGRLSQTAPSFYEEFWVDALGMSALTNTTYPATRNVNYPNHVLYPHNDGYLYVLDYDGANGRIHALISDSDGTDATGEMDLLTLPPQMMPFDAAPYGTDMAIVASPEANFVVGATLESSPAYMYIWDTVRGNRVYRAVSIGEPIASAIVNRSGQLFVAAGNIDDGMQWLRYDGGETFTPVAAVNEGSPPFAGAVDVKGNMIAWGGHVTYPTGVASVFTYGYRDGRLGSDAVHNIAKPDEISSTLPVISALKFLQRGIYPIIGWGDGDPSYGIDKHSSTSTYGCSFLGPVKTIGRPFRIRRIIIPLADAVAAGMSVDVQVWVDNEAASYTGTAENAGLKLINSTNFTSSERIIDFRQLTIEGEHNYYLKFVFSGTVECAISFPVVVEIEMIER